MAKNNSIIVVRAPEGAHVVVSRGDNAEADHDIIPSWQVRQLKHLFELHVLRALQTHFGGLVTFDWEGDWKDALAMGVDIPLVVFPDGGNGPQTPVLIRRIGEMQIVVERVVYSTLHLGR